MRTVTLIAGDPPDLAAQARRVLDASGAKLQWDPIEPPDLDRAASSLKRTRAALAGPTPEDSVLRKSLDLFLLVLPCKSLEGVSPVDLDLALLIGEPSGGRDACGRIAHAAFTYATMHARQKLTLAFRAAETTLREVARDASRDYPQIEFEERPVDGLRAADALDLVLSTDPALAGMFQERIGGPPVVPAVWMGERAALFEGRGPIAIMRAGALLLEHLNEARASDRVERALERAAAALGPLPPLPKLTESILAGL